MRRLLVLSASLSLAVLSAQQAYGWSPTASAKNGPKRSEGEGAICARQLVQIALEAELAGDDYRRELYLREALEQDPRNTQAHWQLGDVFFGAGWLSAEAACRATIDDPRQVEYRDRRIQAGGLPGQQYDLALWCKQARLIDQGRAHLFNAWQDQPELTNNGETLGLIRYEGIWMTPAQAQKAEAEARRTKIALARWKPRLNRMRRGLESADPSIVSKAKAGMKQIDDPSAVPAIEATFSADDNEHGLWAVAVLASIKGQKAATSLVRHAMLSRSPAVRRAAAEALRSRSLYSYAPLLLAALESPVEARLDDISQDGSLALRVSLVREGPMADLALTEYLTLANGDIGTMSSSTAQSANTLVQVANAAAFQATARRTINQVASAVNRANSQIKDMNARIGAALARATDVEPSDRPRDYWQWWYDYNDIYYPPERPVQQVQYTRPVLFNRSCECFAAGTPIWTIEGDRPIERIQVGDMLLAEDVETGEISFKPVVSTSIRPATELLNIKVGDEIVSVTKGHPLWVIGRGWRMAKELSDGDRVRTVSGPVAIERIESGPTQVAYNLVVSEFNTYFAGKAKFLVHDNTIRRHTDVLLPGFTPSTGQDEPKIAEVAGDGDEVR